jgi:hypothetical protein
MRAPLFTRGEQTLAALDPRPRPRSAGQTDYPVALSIVSPGLNKLLNPDQRVLWLLGEKARNRKPRKRNPFVRRLDDREQEPICPCVLVYIPWLPEPFIPLPSRTCFLTFRNCACLFLVGLTSTSHSLLPSPPETITLIPIVCLASLRTAR